MKNNANNGAKSKLQEGTYTYRELMEMVGWAVATSSRPNQMLELQRHCLIQVVGASKNTRYHIIKVYDKPTTNEVFYRPNNEVYRNHEQVLIPKHLMKYGQMIVYKIQFGNMVYIGSTYDVTKRISNHFNGYVNEHTESMLKHGATFEMLEHITTTEDDLRAREIEYIKEYKECECFILINNQHAKA